MPLFLGYDVGTQGTKALLIDSERREVVARASSSYGLIEGLPAGCAEQHPDTWSRALREVTARIVASGAFDAAELRGIGVSGQQHGCVVLDERGEVVRPAKLWCDTSTADEARELGVPVGFTASKLLWLVRREPSHWARVRRVFLPHEWVNWSLTGLATAEPGDASGTGLFDAVERRYDSRRTSRIDPRLERLLPELRESAEPAGMLTRPGARWIGLPDRCGDAVLVASGGGDNMMSAIGAGATRDGVAVLSLGTSATVFARSSKPVVDPRGAIAAFCDSTGAWLPLLCSMNATGVLEEVRAAFGSTLDELTGAAERVEPGSGGAMLVPYLSGERVPDLPRATGALLGLRPGSLRPGVVFRAALEGVALNLAWGVERMRELGLEVDTVRVAGGGARNALWRSILADALGCRVVELAESETAALGAALQALWISERQRDGSLSADEVVRPWIRARGEVEPDAGRAALYRDLGARFREHVERLYG
jgi:xylulokinase